MTEAQPRAIRFLEGYPADVLAIEAVGRVTRADYEEVLMPAVERMAKAEGRIKVFYLIGEAFGGYTAGAIWDDARLGLLHMGDVARVAVVTDVDWIVRSIHLFAPLIPCPVHVFPLADLAAAKDWIASNDPPGHDGPEVDATHKLPMLEDRMPPDP